MKKIIALILTAALITALASCAALTGQTTDTTGQTTDTTGQSTVTTEENNSAAASASAETAADPVTDNDITAAEATGTFTMTTEDGTFENSGSIYTVTSAGTYVLSGLLEGQIIVNAGEDDEVTLELTDATVTYGADSPIKIISAKSVDISAKKGTENVINDTRSTKTTDKEDQGEGAIYAVCDLKIKGAGTLVINAAYNNGIHTKKDLTIQNLSLKVTAYDNALKGNDSITVTSGAVVAISTNGDGIKTENTDTNKNGKTRGDITISGGSVTVYAAGDGFQAAHNFDMTTGEEGAPTVVIYTGSYSGYTASGASTTSYKGVKVQNELNISAGSITLQTYDDGLHADYGTSFDDGTKGQGTVNISGGTVTISVYSPETKTAGGRFGPGGGPGGRGGWGGQQAVSGADGIHADYTLNITGGTVNIDSAYEGLEANVINVSGGVSYVSANDDGVNACKGNTTPQVNVTGGYLDVTVSPNGDTDGIDSNGAYKQTGGIVITRGPSSEMAAAIDADGTIYVTGGTLIVLGYGRISTGGSIKSYSLSLHSAGSHTVNIDGVSYTFNNASAYGRTTVYSDATVSS